MIYSIKDIAHELEQLDKDTLVVFDVDEVLITSKDVFHKQHAEDFLFSLIDQEASKLPTVEAREDLFNKLSLSMVQTERVLVEQEMVAAIKKLQQRGIKTIGLTHFFRGKFGIVPSVERWRVNHLKTLGIDFSESFPGINRHEFSHMKKERESAPTFQDGILFSIGYKKGDVLAAFLQLTQLKPNKVVFVDDLLENHENLQSTLKPYNISFKGLHYLGAQIKSEQFDKKLIEFQFRYLLEHYHWLNDERAKSMIQGSSF